MDTDGDGVEDTEQTVIDDECYLYQSILWKEENLAVDSQGVRTNLISGNKACATGNNFRKCYTVTHTASHHITYICEASVLLVG